MTLLFRRFVHGVSVAAKEVSSPHRMMMISVWITAPAAPQLR